MTLPFENDTGAVVKKLADRSLKADKRRNLFIIVTIAFAVCLMTTLALYVAGKSYELKTFLQGRYQAAVLNIDPQMAETLSEDETVEMVGLEAALNSLRIEDYTLNVHYRDNNDIHLRSIDLEGRLPETENEVAVSSAFLAHTGKEASLGQKITLPLKEEEAAYTICGIIHDEEGRRYYPVLVSDAFLKTFYTGTIPYEGILRIASSERFKPEEVKRMVYGCLGAYGIEESQIAFSSAYFGSIDNSSRDILAILAISVLIVIACGVVIYSLFYISVAGKIKAYGRLHVIGMTKKQIKKMMWKESRKLSLFSIPAGNALGCILGYALVPKGWYFPVSIMCVLGVSALTEIAVMISISSPVKIAASVSPIEAIRMTASTDAAKELATKRLRRKLSAQNLARLNFMRNRKKVAMTLISLGFSGVLLMCGATYFCSADADEMARHEFGKKELSITLSPSVGSTMQNSPEEAMNRLQENNPLSDTLIQELLQNKDITEIEEKQGIYASLFLPREIDAESSINETVHALSKEQMETHASCLLSGTMDYDTLVKEHGILVDHTGTALPKLYKYDLKLGDQIEIFSDTGERIAFTVAGTVDFGKEYNGNLFFLPLDLMRTLRSNIRNFNMQLSIRTDLQKLPAVEMFVFEKLSGNQDFVIESYTDVLAFMQERLKIYTTPIYGLIVFIALFGVINLINTLMTNLVSRQQEFGILQSIGLSGKQLSEMLRIESLYYVLGAMAITLTIGTAAGYCLCRVFDQAGLFGKLHYAFPVVQAFLFFAALLVIAGVYSRLAIRYCRKQPLVERIKAME